MPSIDAAARAALLGPIGACPVCGRDRVRHYCRTCDEFFWTCDRERPCDPTARDHDTHRLYLWTPGGILAIPDFDNFPNL
jgi:hypothetical protein